MAEPLPYSLWVKAHYAVLTWTSGIPPYQISASGFNVVMGRYHLLQIDTISMFLTSNIGRDTDNIGDILFHFSLQALTPPMFIFC